MGCSNVVSRMPLFLAILRAILRASGEPDSLSSNFTFSPVFLSVPITINLADIYNHLPRGYPVSCSFRENKHPAKPGRASGYARLTRSTDERNYHTPADCQIETPHIKPYYGCAIRGRIHDYTHPCDTSFFSGMCRTRQAFIAW